METKFNATHKVLLFLSSALLLLSWLYVILNYSALPDQVVAHMDLEGNVNRYDSKNILWFLLILFTILSGLFLWFLDKNQFTNPNIKSKGVTRTIMLLSILFINLVLLALVIIMIQKTMHPDFDTNWFMYSLIILTALLIGSVIVISYKNIKK